MAPLFQANCCALADRGPAARHAIANRAIRIERVRLVMALRLEEGDSNLAAGGAAANEEIDQRFLASARSEGGDGAPVQAGGWPRRPGRNGRSRPRSRQRRWPRS